MENFRFELTIYIGRFQPFHNGHAALLAEALALGRQVIVVLGSAFGARNPKNPFTWQEREAMIRATLTPEESQRVTFLPIRDYYDDKRWVAAVQAGVAQLSDSKSTALVGHFKDDSSYYLDRFPAWAQESCPRAGNIDATALRNAYFPRKPGLLRRLLARMETWFGVIADDPLAGALALLTTRVPPAVVQFLDAFRHTPEYTRLLAENRRIQAIKAQWAGSPYEPTFITVDALVLMQNKVLLIRRKGDLGDGLVALPGGYLEPRERLVTSATRELREESNFGLYGPTLEDSLVSVTVFDHPDRSLRGRTVTHLHLFDLKDRAPLEVRGNGSEGEPFWADVEDLPAMEDQFFEDHFHMLDDRLGLTDKFDKFIRQLVAFSN